MDLSFDAAKNEKNIAAHGMALSEAEHLDWDAMIAAVDTRKEYGETRLVGYAPMGERLYCVVFVERTEGRRIISLRKANSREVDRYEKSQAD